MAKTKTVEDNSFYEMDLNVIKTESVLDKDGNEKEVVLIIDKNTTFSENLVLGLRPFIQEYEKQIRKF